MRKFAKALRQIKHILTYSQLRFPCSSQRDRGDRKLLNKIYMKKKKDYVYKKNNLKEFRL